MRFQGVLLGLFIVASPAWGGQPGPHDTKGTTPLNLSRPTSNPVLEGTVVIKAVDLNDDTPFLRVRGADGSARDYLIQTCDEDCQKKINACKGGERCSIRGKIDEADSAIMAEFVRLGPPPPETKTSKKKDGSVVTWTRDSSHPKLGEAWRDPRGVIWGDVVKKETGSPRQMMYIEAGEYCKSIGAELPSREDFMILREYMGAASMQEYDRYYSPQVLPNLGDLPHIFWSSSIADWSAYSFQGRDGVISDFRGDIRFALKSVRCIVRTANAK